MKEQIVGPTTRAKMRMSKIGSVEKESAPWEDVVNFDRNTARIIQKLLDDRGNRSTCD